MGRVSGWRYGIQAIGLGHRRHTLSLPPKKTTKAGGTYPTGMLSCSNLHFAL